MNRSIEQALLSLLPTHNSELPPPLADLASSLLAQSRHRASILKAEEEIARPYACAHLACDRLKTTLNLPPIAPRPPIPPRIYKRLYNHLDKILPAPSSTPSRSTPGGALGLGGSGRTRTPGSKLREQQHILGTSPWPTTAAATTTTSVPDTPSKKRTGSKNNNSSINDSVNLPRWIRPTLRLLLTRLGPAHIGPVVATGLESIITPRGKLTADAWVRDNLAAVVGGLYVYVWRGVTWPVAGEKVDRARYVKFRNEVASCLGVARGQVEIPRNRDDDDEKEEAWEGWGKVTGKELDEAVLTGNRHGWFDMEWVKGVGDLVERERARAEEDADADVEEEERIAAVQISRPDTMFQERYDYLSERKRKAYAEWKEGALKRIKELEAR
ncbi:origin recognition complex, subunit 6 [Chaetomium strumarium]|uniref:Origin recognition complex, subunit 6 n=1 Tax=Chaetomium strumarium TaxID=1170767 RepID=A0AAJ0GQB1_9PEZI|nr:origin recognition complex, subunit 6 [Chaetomium strumarium]